MSDTIKVFVADDHDLVRHGIITFLKTLPDITFVGEAADGQATIDHCERLQPDIILMDLIMPHVDGVEAIKILQEKLPGTKIIALTSFDDDELVESAIQAGATGYLLKNVSTDELADAIRKASKGKSTLSQEATRALIRASRRPSIENYNLTPREKEVLGLMVKGMTNVEIADTLVISRSTVKKHVRNILGKLGTSNRTEATALALQEELVEED